MGAKYEVIYWDYFKDKEVTEEHTNSLFRALYLVYKLEKRWYCVTVKLRRNKVKTKTFKF